MGREDDPHLLGEPGDLRERVVHLDIGVEVADRVIARSVRRLREQVAEKRRLHGRGELHDVVDAGHLLPLAGRQPEIARQDDAPGDAHRCPALLGGVDDEGHELALGMVLEEARGEDLRLREIVLGNNCACEHCEEHYRRGDCRWSILRIDAPSNGAAHARPRRSGTTTPATATSTWVRCSPNRK